MQVIHAPTQYRLQAADLEVLLALTRTGTLAEAARRLAVDASTVFRSVQRPSLEAQIHEQIASATRATGEGTLDSLLRAGETWDVR